MSAAIEALKKGHKQAVEQLNRIKADTRDDIEAGKRAQSRLDTAQQEVDEFTEAIDRLDRPEQFKGQDPDSDGPVVWEPRVAPLAYERPEVEERVIAGVSITRRSAEG